MGWVLHSKMFKEKLTKWIIMYIAVMCLLGSVITYSRYITSLQKDPEDVKPARFNVVMEPVFEKCEDGTITKTDKDGNVTVIPVDKCGLSSRPTKGLEYTFSVNYDELDANALVIIRMAFNGYSIMNYKNIVLYEIISSEDEQKEIPLFEFKDDKSETTGKLLDEKYKIKTGDNSILLYDIIRMSDVYKFDADGKVVGERESITKTFRIKMETSDNVLNIPEDSTEVAIPSGEHVYNKDIDNQELITIGYTATQFMTEEELSKY